MPTHCPNLKNLEKPLFHSLFKIYTLKLIVRRITTDAIFHQHSVKQKRNAIL